MPPKIKTKPRRGEGVAFPLGTTVFDPNAPWRLAWDQLCMLLLIICAFLTPFEVGFLPSKGLPDPDILWYLNHLIDVVFITDMLFSFNTAYFDYRYSLVLHAAAPFRSSSSLLSFIGANGVPNGMHRVPSPFLLQVVAMDRETGKNLERLHPWLVPHRLRVGASLR